MNYYIPIATVNLADYFVSAIIAPVKYEKDRFPDIQSRYENYLVISRHPFAKNSDCAMEVVLTAEEKESLMMLSDGYWLFARPLPVTRVRKILFRSIEQQRQTLSSIRLNTAFIPDSLPGISDEQDGPEPSDVFVHAVTGKDYTENIDRFERTLGGLALMRLVTEGDMNFSEHYFSLLSSFNSLIKRDVEKANQMKPDLFNTLYKNYVRTYYNRPITDRILKEVAASEGQRLRQDPYKMTWDLERLQNATYILAFIRDRKVNDKDEGRDKIDRYIVDRFSQVKQAEEVAFYYGYNKKYSSFAKSYKTSADNEVAYKYQLDTCLDYYTIESIYQYHINDNRANGDFPYLKEWCSNKYQQLSHTKTGPNEYVVLDQVVVKKRPPKMGSEPWWRKIFNSFFSQQTENPTDIYRQLFEKPLQSLLKNFGEMVLSASKKDWEEERKSYEEIIQQLQQKVAEQEQMMPTASQPVVEATIATPNTETAATEIKKEEVAVQTTRPASEEVKQLIQELQAYLSECDKPAKGKIRNILGKYSKDQSCLGL